MKLIPVAVNSPRPGTAEKPSRTSIHGSKQMMADRLGHDRMVSVLEYFVNIKVSLQMGLPDMGSTLDMASDLKNSYSHPVHWSYVYLLRA